MLYRAILLLHLLGVLAFFSNAVAAFFWQARAGHTRDPTVLAHTFRTLVAGDLWITPIAVAVVLASGVGLSVLAGVPILATGWVLWSLVAFLGSGGSCSHSGFCRCSGAGRGALTSLSRWPWWP